MRYITFCILTLPFLFVNCSDGHVKSFNENYQAEKNMETDSSTKVDKMYMYTGFYNVVGDRNAIRMQKYKSEEIYTLSPKPFASINDVVKVELEKTKLSSGVCNELCLTFNSKGKEDIKDGTGSGKYARIAIVVANRLLYVVENRNSIEGEKVSIILEDYSEKEMQIILNEVRQKK